MKTYSINSIKDILNPTMKKLNKKFNNKISFLKASWQDIAPNWAQEAIPYAIKNDTIFFKAKNNALLLQFKEKELLKIINLILNNIIKKVKILAI